MALLSVSDVFQFNDWDQVSVFWDAGVQPFSIINHKHFLRYLVSYPGFLLQEEIPSIGFSIYLSIFFSINISLFRLLSFEAFKRSVQSWAWMIFAVSQLFMNGRGLVAWTGWLICIYLCLRINKGESMSIGKLSLITISIMFASVTSGVFIVTIFTIFVFILSEYKSFFNTRKKSFFFLILLFMLIAFFYSKYFIAAIEKNISFFGGGIEGLFNMTSHGLGKFFFGSFIGEIAFFALIEFAFLAIVFLKIKRYKINPFQKLFLIALCGGGMGFLTLTLLVPVTILYFMSLREPRHLLD